MKTTVNDLLIMAGGNTNFQIQGTTEKGKIVQLVYGKVDDIKFPLVPYGDFEVQHISVDENRLYIVLDDKYNFRQLDPKLTYIKCNEFQNQDQTIIG